ncbi:hypothetical protein Pelo_18359 [Pelomyxa schiedti]|nr:hypothetical protein Pelo_18359 [Pelomyxa schiedti]
MNTTTSTTTTSTATSTTRTFSASMDLPHKYGMQSMINTLPLLVLVSGPGFAPVQIRDRCSKSVENVRGRKRKKKGTYPTSKCARAKGVSVEGKWVKVEVHYTPLVLASIIVEWGTDWRVTRPKSVMEIKLVEIYLIVHLEVKLFLSSYNPNLRIIT